MNLITVFFLKKNNNLPSLHLVLIHAASTNSPKSLTNCTCLILKVTITRALSTIAVVGKLIYPSNMDLLSKGKQETICLILYNVNTVWSCVFLFCAHLYLLVLGCLGYINRSGFFTKPHATKRIKWPPPPPLSLFFLNNLPSRSFIFPFLHQRAVLNCEICTHPKSHPNDSPCSEMILWGGREKKHVFSDVVGGMIMSRSKAVAPTCHN